LDIRLSSRNVESPVANRKADVVQAEGGMTLSINVAVSIDFTYPAAAMSRKSDSVIQVSQWFCSVAKAFVWS